MFIPGKTGGSTDRKATNDLRQLQGQMTGGYGSTYGGRQTTVPKTDMGKININAQNLWNLYTDNATYAGRQAAMDTAGTQVAQTEGYGNSWAKQQAGNAYLDYLNNLNGNMNAIVQSATPRTGGKKKLDPGMSYKDYVFTYVDKNGNVFTREMNKTNQGDAVGYGRR